MRLAGLWGESSTEPEFSFDCSIVHVGRPCSRRAPRRIVRAIAARCVAHSREPPTFTCARVRSSILLSIMEKLLALSLKMVGVLVRAQSWSRGAPFSTGGFILAGEHPAVDVPASRRPSNCQTH